MKPFMREDKDLDEMAEACMELFTNWEHEVLGLLDSTANPADETTTVDGIKHEILARRCYPNKSGQQELQVQIAGKVDSHSNHKWFPLSDLYQLGKKTKL